MSLSRRRLLQGLSCAALAHSLGAKFGHAEQETSTLRAAASAFGFNIGVTVGGYGGPDTFKPLTELQTREFNLALVGLYWEISEPQQGQFRFQPFQTNLARARAAGMSIFAHPIIWAGALPPWVRQGSFSRDELLKVMYERISSCLERFSDGVDTFDVVNEAYNRDDLFRDVIGPEYVEMAFASVRQQAPGPRLLYNDFLNHFERAPRTAVTREIVARLADKGLIDCVGLQMHLEGDRPPDKADVIRTMQSYGLPVYVTEFDVNLRNVRGTRDERFARQAQIYGEMLEAAVESGVCQNFVVFQVVDQYTIWEMLPQFAAYSPDADPSPFDDDFSPKPAYFTMMDVFRRAAGR